MITKSLIGLCFSKQQKIQKTAAQSPSHVTKPAECSTSKPPHTSDIPSSEITVMSQSDSFDTDCSEGDSGFNMHENEHVYRRGQSASNAETATSPIRTFQPISRQESTDFDFKNQFKTVDLEQSFRGRAWGSSGTGRGKRRKGKRKRQGRGRGRGRGANRRKTGKDFGPPVWVK